MQTDKTGATKYLHLEVVLSKQGHVTHLVEVWKQMLSAAPSLTADGNMANGLRAAAKVLNDMAWQLEQKHVPLEEQLADAIAHEDYELAGRIQKQILAGKANQPTSK